MNSIMIKAKDDDRVFLIDFDRLSVDLVESESSKPSAAQNAMLDFAIVAGQRSEVSAHPMYKPN